MEIAQNILSTFQRLMQEQERSFAWLARATGIPYKTLLAEVKHAKRPLSLETAIRVAKALGHELPEFAAAA